MAGILDYLGYAGNLLDLPGSSVRDLLTGNNPFDQWATPFSDKNRASGRDVLRPLLGENEETGMSGWLTNPMEGLKDVAGFGVEVLADPLNFLSGGAVLRALRGGKAARARNALVAAENAANAGRYSYVNPKMLTDDMLGATDDAAAVVNPISGEAEYGDIANRISQIQGRMKDIESVGDEMGTRALFSYMFDEDYTPRIAEDLRQEYDTLKSQLSELGSRNPMRRLGYTPAPEDPMFPGREVMYHGGHNWAPSATPEHPYGMFDIGYKGIGEGGQMYGPGFYTSDAQKVSEHYRDMVQEGLNKSATKTPVYALRSVIEDFAGKFEDTVDPTEVRQFFSGGHANPVMSQAGQLFDVIQKHDFLGADPSDPFFWEEIHSAMASRSDLEKYVNEVAGLAGIDPNSTKNIVDDLSRFTSDKYGGKAYLYQLTAPQGSKARYMRWNDPLSGQPEAARRVLENPMKVLDPTFAKDIDETFKASVALRKHTSDLDRLEREYNAVYDKMDSLPPEHPDQPILRSQRDKIAARLTEAEDAQFAAREQIERFKEEYLDREGMPYDLMKAATRDRLATEPVYGSLNEAWQALDGEGLADAIMGAHPSDATFANVTGLLRAGVPGMSNPAHIVRGATNYVTWDPALINQMQVRAINGERVPINPTTLVQQTEVPTFRAQPSNTELIQAINPMRPMEAVPSARNPAVAMVLQNLLARQNGAGGDL